MMTINQREKQTRLQARMDELRAEIAFAQNGEKPWPYRACRESEGLDAAKNTVNIVRIYWCGMIGRGAVSKFPLSGVWWMKWM